MSQSDERAKAKEAETRAGKGLEVELNKYLNTIYSDRYFIFWRGDDTKPWYSKYSTIDYWLIPKTNDEIRDGITIKNITTSKQFRTIADDKARNDIPATPPIFVEAKDRGVSIESMWISILQNDLQYEYELKHPGEYPTWRSKYIHTTYPTVLVPQIKWTGAEGFNHFRTFFPKCRQYFVQRFSNSGDTVFNCDYIVAHKASFKETPDQDNGKDHMNWNVPISYISPFNIDDSKTLLRYFTILGKPIKSLIQTPQGEKKDIYDTVAKRQLENQLRLNDKMDTKKMKEMFHKIDNPQFPDFSRDNVKELYFQNQKRFTPLYNLESEERINRMPINEYIKYHTEDPDYSRPGK